MTIWHFSLSLAFDSWEKKILFIYSINDGVCRR